jgi:hypothetical protein
VLTCRQLVMCVHSSHSRWLRRMAGAHCVRAILDDDECYQISPGLTAIGTAANSVERKLLITSTTRAMLGGGVAQVSLQVRS